MLGFDESNEILHTQHVIVVDEQDEVWLLTGMCRVLFLYVSTASIHNKSLFFSASCCTATFMCFSSDGLANRPTTNICAHIDSLDGPFEPAEGLLPDVVEQAADPQQQEAQQACGRFDVVLRQTRQHHSAIMSKFAQFLPLTKRTKESYYWEDTLRYFGLQTKEDKGISMRKYIVPVHSFNEHIFREHLYHVKEGVIVEIEDFTEDYGKSGPRTVWFARVLKVGGYRLLCRWIGGEPAVDTGSRSHSDCDCFSFQPKQSDEFYYRPPTFILKKWKDHIMKYIESEVGTLSTCKSLGQEFHSERKRLMSSKFKMNQRVELLSTIGFIRPARITDIKGRRVRVAIREDESSSPKNPNDDSYLDLQYGKDAEYWLDQDSFMIFHVGWACLNDFKLIAKESYVSHARRIADALKNGELPAYHTDDAKVKDVMKWRKSEGAVEFKLGMKLELYDPFDTTFKNIHPATIVKVLRDGYVIVQADDEDEEDALPLHCTSNYLYPVGYATKYKLPIVDPKTSEPTNKFDWGRYLKESRAEAAPECLFPEFDPEEIQKKFPIDARLEAADCNELNLICPASITSVHGRVLRIHFLGWGSDVDQLFDYKSNDIFPLGFCELYNYPLQFPSDKKLDPPEVTEVEDDERPRKKKKKK
ncbi:hypothetical protein WR25_17942 [Diploscapter pachys]|uniref:Tudor domain-containing protein n=1 Tax=Diploscapter pachys TaxID=2018661 RepID=A0A2A2LCW2_9BILA|nr:hypothetical protein WR25_17942 [Diploscapter pachys]